MSFASGMFLNLMGGIIHEKMAYDTQNTENLYCYESSLLKFYKSKASPCQEDFSVLSLLYMGESPLLSDEMEFFIWEISFVGSVTASATS